MLYKVQGSQASSNEISTSGLKYQHSTRELSEDSVKLQDTSYFVQKIPRSKSLDTSASLKCADSSVWQLSKTEDSSKIENGAITTRERDWTLRKINYSFRIFNKVLKKITEANVPRVFSYSTPRVGEDPGNEANNSLVYNNSPVY